jgi:hypothetical protein
MAAPDRWRLWTPPTGGGYGRPRPMAVMDTPDRWQLWPPPTDGGYGRPRPVAVMAAPDRWRLWTPSTGGGYGRPRLVAVVFAAAAIASALHPLRPCQDGSPDARWRPDPPPSLLNQPAGDSLGTGSLCSRRRQNPCRCADILLVMLIQYFSLILSATE